MEKALHSKRQYKILEHPEYLVLEYFENILLWEKQVDALEKLKEDSAAIELIMGSGKSAVLLPLLKLAKADGKKLAIGVVPAPLLSEVSEMLSKRSGRSFRQVVEVIEIDRRSDLDSPISLDLLDLRLTTAIEEQKVILMRDSDIQSLFLRFAEVLFETAPPHSKDIKYSKISKYRKIFALLVNSGVVTVDEIDSIMNVLRSHHYAIGNPELLQDSIISGTKAFYKVLMTHPEIIKQFDNDSVIGQVTKNQLTQKDLKTTLVEAIVESYNFGKKNEMHIFLKSLTSSAKEKIIEYLKGSEKEVILEFIEHIPS